MRFPEKPEIRNLEVIMVFRKMMRAQEYITGFLACVMILSFH